MTRSVLLTNFVPPYRVSLYREMSHLLGHMTILVSSQMESNRSWEPEWEDLDVIVQRTVTLRARSGHPHGFEEELHVHLPWDTIPLLLKLAPDILISSEFGLRSAQAVIYAVIRRRTLVLWATVSEISEAGRGWMRRALRKVLLKRARLVVVNGESGARYIRSFGVPDEHIIIAPYTSHMKTVIKGAARHDEIMRLLYVGQLIPRKGIAEMAGALSDVSTRNPDLEIELVVVGEGEESHLLRALSLSQVSVQFKGHVDYEELSHIYAHCDIFVFPTLADEWGLVVNEALSAGLPVLGSEYSQAVEELVDGSNGWRFRPDDLDDFTTTLERALRTERTRLYEMGRNAQRKMQDVNPRAVADRIATAIRQVV